MITSIRAKKVDPSGALVAEAVVRESGFEDVYLTYQLYDVPVYAVSKESLYGYLAEEGAEPAEDAVTEEYNSLEEAMDNTGYGYIFSLLHLLAMQLGSDD